MSKAERQIVSLLGEAVELSSPEERAVFLEKACAGDAGKRARVEELLRAYQAAGNFLQGNRPPSEPVATVDDPIHERPGTVIGPYKLMEEIGEGGMGLVFVAEQQQPVRRKVALKVIKPGMDSRQVIARFEAERQALAMMDHPHIAKVYDGGATPEGRPYFVMELVKGKPITDYCDRHRLPMRQRLALFLDVCHAVQHAHQKGIIHRDLKPSNVLVSLQDVTPVVKVIDFGVAKATSGRLTDKTVYTALSQMVGTPMYMSPEQAGLSDIDVDTRSDVYSLGVLLYELLTGTTPFDREQLKEVSYDEIRRIIREDEPPRPSTRLSTIQKAELSTIAERRGMEPQRLTQQVRGELDWIVMKALEKDRNRRYETVSALAADVQRYLHDEPVQACPPSAGYRLRKFARRNRNRLTVAALALTLGLLAVGILAAFLLQNAGRMRQLMQDVQQALAGARTAIEARDLALARQRVSEAQGRLGTERASLPGLATEVDSTQEEIAARQTDEDRFQQFVKLASDAQDKMGYGGSLGGDRIAGEALDLYEVLAENEWLSRLEKSSLTAEQQRQVRETAYVTLVSLADYEVRWDTPDHRPSAPRSLDLLKRALAFHEPTRAFYFVRSQCHHLQGDTAAAEEDKKRFQVATARTAWDHYLPGHTAGWGGDLKEAMRSYRAALAMQPNHYNSLFFLASRLATDEIKRYPEAIAYFTGCIALRPNHIYPYINRAECHEKLGQLDEAEADYSAAIAVAPDEENRIDAYTSRRCFYGRRGHTKKAGQDQAQIIQLTEQLRERAKDRLDREYLIKMHNLAHAYNGAGRLPEAIKLYEQTLENLKARLGPDHPDTLQSMNNLAVTYFSLGRHAEALKLNEKTLALRKAKLGPDDPDTLSSMNNLAVEYESAGRPLEAIKLNEETLEKRKAKFGPDHPDTLVSMNNLAFAYMDAGKLDQADRLGRELLALQRKKDGPKSTDNTLAILSYNLLKQKKYAEAEPLLRECMAIRKETLPAEHWVNLDDRLALGVMLLGQQKYAEAEPLLQQGYEGMKQREAQLPPRNKKWLTEAVERIVQLYEAAKQPEKARTWREKLSSSKHPGK